MIAYSLHHILDPPPGIQQNNNEVRRQLVEHTTAVSFTAFVIIWIIALIYHALQYNRFDDQNQLSELKNTIFRNRTHHGL